MPPVHGVAAEGYILGNTIPTLLLVRLCTVIASLALSGPAAAKTVAPDAASTAEGLAGWWIAVDDWWPNIRKGAAIAPFEELVVIEADGRIESRAMGFDTPDAAFCVKSGHAFCSDAPLMGSGRLSRADDTGFSRPPATASRSRTPPLARCATTRTRHSGRSPRRWSAS